MASRENLQHPHMDPDHGTLGPNATASSPLRALWLLYAMWAVLSAAFIQVYALRYASPGYATIAHGASAIAGLWLIFAPAGIRARLSVPRRLFSAAGAVLLLGALVPFATQVFHVGMVLSMLTLVLMAAWLTARLPGGKWTRRLAIAVPLATAHFLLCSYYVVLVVGRETWRQVIGRDLIVTYARQIPELIAALPVDPWIPVATVAAAYLLMLGAYLAASTAICRALHSLAPEPRTLVTSPRGVRATGAVLAAGACIVSTPVAGELLSRNLIVDFQDPLAITLFADQKTPNLGHMPLSVDPVAIALDRKIAASYAAPARNHRKNLVVITVDSARADQMGVYGHERDNTPFLSALMKAGKLTRFENAFSTCAESFCGLMAVQTARYWHQTGERNFALPDVLRRLGYRNHFILGGDHTNFYGLRAFYGDSIDEYRDGSDAPARLNDDQQVVDWVGQIAANDGVPRYVFIHLMSSHFLGKRHPQYEKWRAIVPERDPSSRIDAKVMRYVEHYHNGLLQADAMIAQIFERLRTKGLLDDAIVVITADHGEMLGEAVEMLHGGTPLDPVLRVPLLVYDSEGFAYPKRSLASIIDIAPTLLARIGAPVPEHWAGRSLTEPEGRPFALAQSGREFAIMGWFGADLYKYRYTVGSPGEQLYDLNRDPHEERPLALAAHADIVNAFRGQAVRPNVASATRH